MSEVHQSLRANVVNPEVLMEAVFGLSQTPRPLERDEISRFIDCGTRYTKAVIHLGEELNLMQEVDSGFEVNSDIAEEVRKLSPDQRFVILNKYLQRYKPFIAFLSFLSKGYEPDRAAVQVDVLYDLGISEEKIKKQFIKLGTYSNLLENDNGTIAVSAKDSPISEEYIQELEDALKSEATARIFIEDQIGEDVVAYMNDKYVDELATALVEHNSSPRNSISAAGRAVEDFQRDIGNDYGTSGNYSSASGIGQLATELHKENWTMKRHLHGGNYLGGMRNPSGGHGYNPKTLERWDVQPEVAVEYALAAMHYIRSLYRSAEDNKQVL